MRKQIAIGGNSNDLNSRRSTSEIINGYVQVNASGDFRRIRRAQGLEPFATLGAGPIRGSLAVRNELFAVSGPDLYSVDTLGNETLLGTVGGSSGPVRLGVNGTEARQVLTVAGGKGFIWDGTLFQQVIDPDFTPDIAVAVLDQRFWLNRPDTNVFFASEVADGLAYSAIDFLSAESSPDETKYVVAQNTNLWVFGGKTVEYWQTTLDAIPLRRVAGATIERGVASKFSVVQWQDDIFWLADDLTIWRISGSQSSKISDINFELAIRGDGSLGLPGYSSINTAEGFFLDLPTNKFYCLTFPGDGVTWCYDITTGFWHKRSTRNAGRWKIRTASLFDNQVIVGDYSNGNLYVLSEDSTASDDQDFTIVTPGIYADETDLFISELELIAEFGRTLIKREITLETSKDGGFTFSGRRQLNFGNSGDREHRVIPRRFGRIPRHREFVTRWRMSDTYPIDIYSLFADVEGGI